MKILVTGGAGYLGSVLVRKLLSYKHNVRVLDNFMYGGESLLGAFAHPTLEIFKGDIRNEEDINNAISDCDVVVHLASIVGDPACNVAPKVAYAVNVTGTKKVFSVAREHKINKVVFASTCSNYGKMDRNVTEYLTEDAELNPISQYATHKVLTENLLIDQYSDLNPVILRFSTLYGISPRMRFDLTINQFAMEAVVDRHLEVYGEQFYRPYLHVQDAASCIIQILGLPFSVTAGKIWNVGGTSENYTKKDIVEMIKTMGIEFDVDYVYKDEDPRDYKVSFEKIDRELGFKPLFTVPVGIDEVAELVEVGLLRNPKSNKWRNT
jgi:nucleoside-diphosphate-sugar epimerase